MAKTMATEVNLQINTAGFRAGELKKVRQGLEKFALAVRDAEIKARYDDLKPRKTQTEAIAQLAGEYELSESTINAILWPR